MGDNININTDKNANFAKDQGTIVNVTVELGDLIKELKGNPRNYDLLEKLREIQEKAYDLQDENRELRDENNKLREKLSFKENLKLHDSVYWSTDENGNLKEPFCFKCWEEKKKITRLPDSHNGRWICAVCRYVHTGKTYKSPTLYGY